MDEAGNKVEQCKVCEHVLASTFLFLQMMGANVKLFLYNSCENTLNDIKSGFYFLFISLDSAFLYN